MVASTFDQRYFELTNADPYIQSVARPGQVIVKKMPYEYGVQIGTATTPLTVANGAITVPLTTLADSDFVMTSIAACVNIDSNSNMKFNRNVTLQIQDTATGKYFFSAPAVMGLVSGGGGFPFVFPAPRVIRPNTILLFTGQNRDVSQAYQTMYITIGGTRIFYADQTANA